MYEKRTAFRTVLYDSLLRPYNAQDQCAWVRVDHLYPVLRDNTGFEQPLALKTYLRIHLPAVVIATVLNLQHALIGCHEPSLCTTIRPRDGARTMNAHASDTGALPHCGSGT